MFPLLRDARDVVVLVRPKGKLRRLDVALYRSERDEYVLHRLLYRRGDQLVFCGDSRLTSDPPVEEKRVVAVMTDIYHKNRHISVKRWPYRVYAHVWCWNIRLRRLLLRVCYWLAKHHRHSPPASV
ncbi:MAG: S24/S26 family peptidase [Eubacteriales bacterium]|nr:S24/S26 family peptidase [Eubacteriales bacterium]